MKVLIIGGVAAGTKTAAKLKREDRSLDITILTKGKDISYAGCGLPYYVGNVIPNKEQLIVNTPESFEKLTGVKVRTEMEVTALHRQEKTVDVKNLATGETEVCSYDKLVIATGASPIKPPLPGLELPGVYFMRTPQDAITLRENLDTGNVKRAVVVGGGFIGLEVAENLASKGVKVSVLDMAPQILPGFAPEFAEYVENHLADQGIMCFTGTKLEGILGEGKVEKVKTDRRAMKADLAVLSIGIRANTGFLADTGIELMPNRTVKVNQYMQTNDEDIYALGDCAMVTNRLTGAPQWSPMGSSANIEGRVAAMNIAGHANAYPGVLGTAVCKLPDLNCGRCGITEEQAMEAGFAPETVITVVDDKAHYYPGAASFTVKMVGDKNTHKLLGLQVLGKGAVDKMVDIAVAVISLGGTVDDISSMDFAYAPPFSTAIHPIAHTANVWLNKVSGNFNTLTPAEFRKNGVPEGYRIVDASPAPTIKGAPYVDLSTLDGPVEGLDKDDKLLLICAKGKRAYMVQNRLKYFGYTNTLVLEGGLSFNSLDDEEE